MIVTIFAVSIVAAISPSRDDKLVGVLFAPSLSENDAFQKVVDAGGRVVAMGALPNSFIVERRDKAFSRKIGALVVFRADSGWGCAPLKKMTALG